LSDRAVFFELFSGDGGNRTRVRKNRPANFYERSNSLVSRLARWFAEQESHYPLRPESLLSQPPRRGRRQSDFVAPASTTGQTAEQADVTYERSFADHPSLGSEGESSVLSAIGTW